MNDLSLTDNQNGIKDGEQNKYSSFSYTHHGFSKPLVLL